MGTFKLLQINPWQNRVPDFLHSQPSNDQKRKTMTPPPPTNHRISQGPSPPYHLTENDEGLLVSRLPRRIVAETPIHCGKRKRTIVPETAVRNDVGFNFNKNH